MLRSTRSQRSLLASLPSSIFFRSQETSIFVATRMPPSSSCSSRARAAFSRSATLLQAAGEVEEHRRALLQRSVELPVAVAKLFDLMLAPAHVAPEQGADQDDEQETQEARRAEEDARGLQVALGALSCHVEALRLEIPEFPQLVPQVNHRARAGVGVHELERRVAAHLAVEAERGFHLADLLARIHT